MITPPYIDAASGAIVITMSRVIFEGRSVHNIKQRRCHLWNVYFTLHRSSGIHNPSIDEVIAVMGVDLLLPYFQTIITQLYPLCNEAGSFT